MCMGTPMSRAEWIDGGEFPAVEALMPHRGPVVLLDRILTHDSQYTEARVSIAGQRWLKREDGSVPAWLAVEYMAQCVAVRDGLLALEAGRPPPKGYLVGVTRLFLETPEFEADAELRVRSQRVRGRPSLGALSHQCSLYRNLPNGEMGALLAKGRLSVSVPRGASL
jgi:predicted hotdog family 3-hydroxylacyl-ACP dehydratase